MPLVGLSAPFLVGALPLLLCVPVLSEPETILNGQKVGKDFVNAISQGRELQKRKQLKQASLQFLKALQIAPGNREALYYSAECLFELKRFDEAKDTFDKLSKLEPDNDGPLFRCAESMWNSGKFSGAITYYEKVLALRPKEPAAYYEISKCMDKLNRPEEAVRNLLKVIELAPRNSHAYYDLVRILISKENYTDALPIVKQLEKMPNYFEEAYFTESSIHACRGELQKAIDVCNEFLVQHGECKDACSEMSDRSACLRRKLNDMTTVTDFKSYRNECKLARWQGSAPISVFIETPRNVRFWTPAHNVLVHSAFSKWEKASAGAVHFRFVDKVQRANILCSWTDNKRNLRAYANGQTIASISSGHFTEGARIKLLTTMTGKVALSREAILSAAVHEVGHALGISAHSGMPSDVMYFRNTQTELSPRDIATLFLLCNLGSEYSQSSKTPIAQPPQSSSK